MNRIEVRDADNYLVYIEVFSLDDWEEAEAAYLYQKDNLLPGHKISFFRETNSDYPLFYHMV